MLRRRSPWWSSDLRVWGRDCAVLQNQGVGARRAVERLCRQSMEVGHDMRIRHALKLIMRCGSRYREHNNWLIVAPIPITKHERIKSSLHELRDGLTRRDRRRADRLVLVMRRRPRWRGFSYGSSSVSVAYRCPHVSRSRE
jgi:hypothetical protein